MIPAVCARDVRHAARARIAELGITYDTVDAIAGFPDKYTSKLLCEPPLRNFSVDSMFSLLGAIALSPALQPDDKRLEKLRKRPEWLAPKLEGKQYRMKKLALRVHRPLVIHLSSELLAQARRLGGLNSRKRVGKKRARQIAKRAARARWAKHLSITGPRAAVQSMPQAAAPPAPAHPRLPQSADTGAAIGRAVRP